MPLCLVGGCIAELYDMLGTIARSTIPGQDRYNLIFVFFLTSHSTVPASLMVYLDGLYITEVYV